MAKKETANDFLVKLAFHLINTQGFEFTCKAFHEASVLIPIGQLSPRSLVQLSTETAFIADNYEGIDKRRQ